MELSLYVNHDLGAVSVIAAHVGNIDTIAVQMFRRYHTHVT